MKSSVATSFFAKWSFSAVVVAFLGSGCAATNELENHPANAKIQHEITEIVNGLRREQGTALYADLRRLVAYDVFSVEQVALLAKDPNARLRSNALWVLAQIRDPDYPRINERVDALLRSGLDDSDGYVRYEAAAGLAARNDWDVLPILINGLEEKDSGVRFRCHEQLLATTSRDFGYTVDAPDDARKEAVTRWRVWFADWQKSHA
jgi:hypothetical protein